MPAAAIARECRGQEWPLAPRMRITCARMSRRGGLHRYSHDTLTDLIDKHVELLLVDRAPARIAETIFPWTPGARYRNVP